MDKISVTIGIPVYQVETCIEKSLISALSQTYKNLEFIIIDDVGTDHSIDIARRLISTSSRKERVRIISHESNKGLGEARNTIIKHTQTDYLYFMDSDDIITPECIETLVKKATENFFPDIIISGYRQVKNGKEQDVVIADKELFLANKTDILNYYRNKDIVMTSWNKLYRTNFIHENQIYYKHRYHEDYYFSLQELLYAHNMLLLPTITYNYILRDNSITGGLMLQYETIARLMIVQQDIKNLIIDQGNNPIFYVKRYLNLISYIIYAAFVVGHKDIHNIINQLECKRSDIVYFRYGYCSKKTRILLFGILLGKSLTYKILKLSYKFIINRERVC